MFHDHDQIQEMVKNIDENIKYLFQIVKVERLNSGMKFQLEEISEEIRGLTVYNIGQTLRSHPLSLGTLGRH